MGLTQIELTIIPVCTISNSYMTLSKQDINSRWAAGTFIYNHVFNSLTQVERNVFASVMGLVRDNIVTPLPAAQLAVLPTSVI